MVWLDTATPRQRSSHRSSRLLSRVSTPGVVEICQRSSISLWSSSNVQDMHIHNQGPLKPSRGRWGVNIARGWPPPTAGPGGKSMCDSRDGLGPCREFQRIGILGPLQDP